MSAFEEELADQIGETQKRHANLVDVGGDAQQCKGDHRGEQLQANGVVVVAEEFADFEVLLDPAEQQFDLPAALVERANRDGRAFEIVGQQRDLLAVFALEADAAQPDGLLPGSDQRR